MRLACAFLSGYNAALMMLFLLNGDAMWAVSGAAAASFALLTVRRTIPRPSPV